MPENPGGGAVMTGVELIDALAAISSITFHGWFLKSTGSDVHAFEPGADPNKVPPKATFKSIPGAMAYVNRTLPSHFESALDTATEAHEDYRANIINHDKLKAKMVSLAENFPQDLGELLHRTRSPHLPGF